MRNLFLLFIILCCYATSSELFLLNLCDPCKSCVCLKEQHSYCDRCSHCEKFIDCSQEVRTTQAVPHHDVSTTTHEHHTTPKPHTNNCDKVGIIDAVARSIFISNSNASQCSDNNQHSNDALVMTLCLAPVSSKWIEGEKVLENGVCSVAAQPYTPVFYHDSTKAIAGILISCDGSELKVFHQECDTTPRVLHVKGNSLTRIHVLTWN